MRARVVKGENHLSGEGGRGVNDQQGGEGEGEGGDLHAKLVREGGDVSSAELLRRRRRRVLVGDGGGRVDLDAGGRDLQRDEMRMR